MEDFDAFVNSKTVKLVAVIVFLLLLYVAFASIFSFWPFSVAAGVVNKVTNPTAIISNYEWFYDQYNAIQAQKANIKALKKDAYERPGMIMVLNSNIAEYNAKSKEITRNLWKAKDIPYSIELEVEE